MKNPAPAMQGRSCENSSGLFLAAEHEQRGTTESGERQRAGFRNGNTSSLHQFAGQQFGKHLINHTPPFGKNTIDLSDSAIGGFFEQYAMAGLAQARPAG